MKVPKSYKEGSDKHKEINFSRECKGCSLSSGSAVGGAGPDDLTKVKLIVISDHTGHYEVKCNYPFWSNEGERQPKRDKKTGYYSILGFRNAGNLLRYKLEQMFELDTYREVWMTNAVKCDPQKVKPQEKHAKACYEKWLDNELAILNKYVPSVPILIAGNLAFKAVASIKGVHLPKKLHDGRRTNYYYLDQHPLVFTLNPAAVCRNEIRLATNSNTNTYGHIVIREVKPLDPQPVGSPWWMFTQDLLCLKPYL